MTDDARERAEMEMFPDDTIPGQQGWTSYLAGLSAFDTTAAAVLREAADEAEAIIADGDVAEVAAPVPGEVGRGAAVDRRDRLYEEPHTWLRERADSLAAPETDPDPTTRFLFTATGPAGDRFEWPAIDHHTAEAVWTLLGRPHHAEIVGRARRHGEAS